MIKEDFDVFDLISERPYCVFPNSVQYISDQCTQKLSYLIY